MKAQPMMRCFGSVNALLVLAGLTCVPLSALGSPVMPVAAGTAANGSAARAGTPLSAELTGIVQDEEGRPLAGVSVSAQGPTTVSVVSGPDGRFTFKYLTPGPYVVRAQRDGYGPSRPRVLRVQAGERQIARLSLSVNRIVPTSVEPTATPGVLEASVGATTAGARQEDGNGQVGSGPQPTVDTHEHGEVAWRLRRAKRSVLKDVETAVAELGGEHQPPARLPGIGRAFGDSARYATGLFADLPLSGELNLLTTSSFERPQDLFRMGGNAPRGVAYVALASPSESGQWTLRGTMTQGDVASWIVAGAFAKRAPATHQYNAGMSYAMQRYLGGNGEALAAIADGARNVGTVYGYDHWTLSSHVALEYGTRYARYDYLERESLLSPRVGFTVRPLSNDTLAIRASVEHLELAPGATEFLPPAVGVYLPPERTFSSLSPDQSFRAERLDRVEAGVEREIVHGLVVRARGFREHVSDQSVTVFGSAPSRGAGIGHYRVGTVGRIEGTGWGAGVEQPITEHLRASVDYTQIDAVWDARTPDAMLLARLAPSALRSRERVHDVTARVNGVIDSTATRMLVVYKVNTGFASSAVGVGAPALDARFDLQVNQALPFVKVTSTSWELLVAVSNLFHDGVYGGSMYDELLVVRPPTRVMGGVTVRF